MYRLLLIWLFLSFVFCGYAQNNKVLIKDSLTNKYQYQETIEIFNVLKDEIYKRIKGNYIRNIQSIQYDTPDKIVMKYEFNINFNKICNVTEILEIKDNKIRFTITDILHQRATFGRWKTLEQEEDKAVLDFWEIKLLSVKQTLLKAVNTSKDW